MGNMAKLEFNDPDHVSVTMRIIQNHNTRGGKAGRICVPESLSNYYGFSKQVVNEVAGEYRHDKRWYYWKIRRKAGGLILYWKINTSLENSLDYNAN